MDYSVLTNTHPPPTTRMGPFGNKLSRDGELDNPRRPPGEFDFASFTYWQ